MENDIEQARAYDIEQARASNMENDIEQARASNMEEDKASSPNKGKYIDEGNASDIEMATNILQKLDNELSWMPVQRNGPESRSSECCRVPKPLRDVNSSRASNMENDIEQARASNMENDIEQARASNMENDIEEARASNMEEDKASSANKGKYIDVGNASDIEMATNIVEKLDNEVRLMSFQPNSSESRRSECCIYRVPKPLRNVNWKVYTPLLISIGPLHRGSKKLEAMEKEKLKYYKKLTERDGVDKKKMFDIAIRIKKQEERLRNCYSEKFKKIESDDFAKMILLDAVFIILFFLESNDEKGPTNFNPKKTSDILEDLMLIENQLPLFIIEKIYDQVSYNSSDNKPKSFLDLATCYLRKHLPLQVVETSPRVEKETSPGVEKETSIQQVLRRWYMKFLGMMFCSVTLHCCLNSLGVKRNRHLTDLLRDLMLSSAIQRSYRPDLVKLKYSAVMLRKAGVRFQVIRDECLVNITFDKGVLKIPHLKVDHNFERRVRNIMAMEQCLYKSKAYICSYIKFMGQLVDSAGDVGLLVRKGIIVHRLGDDAAVSNIINDLCANISDIKCTCFGHISQGLNAHFESPFNNAIATLVLGYFPDIWRGTATVAAAILLILTFIQTLSSVKLFG